LEIRIIYGALEIYGGDFMNQSEEGVCRFYFTRLDEIPDSSGEVYLGRIGVNDCLVNVSEIDYGNEVELDMD